MLNAPLELDIYTHTKETLEKAKLELDYDFSECNLVKSTFLVINAVYPNINDDGKELGTYICTNGQEITTPLAYEEVLKRINKRI